ncbi:hypothetical protein AB0B50_43310 [Streptomyces sp. NPDC041068]|uniref:hypothetical protein n=1 Tax=Streptomyces sp. NPDC041068 TaxID=3155130 RepID=UPI0033FEF01F
MSEESEAEPVPVKLGVRLSNTKSRRDKLTHAQRAALATLGMDWAGAVPVVEAGTAQPDPQPAPSAAPTKQPPRDHHEECDKTHYEGGNCTCDLSQLRRPARSNPPG